MARWTDLAKRQETTANHGGKLAEHRGLVVHTAEGYFEGTISWEENKTSEVSSHFVISKAGEIAQMVDTDTVAWCQRAGNSAWLSAECEGFGGSKHESLTQAQIEALARLLLKCYQVYGVPLQIATSPSGKGLGHHSMGADWGHQDCPGPAIIAQKSAIVARAKQLAGGAPAQPSTEEDEMPQALNGKLVELAAYDEAGKLLDASAVTVVAIPSNTAGLFKGRAMWLGLANDWSTAAKIRLGLFAGGKWSVSMLTLDGRKERSSMLLPVGTTKISLGRCRSSETAVPVGWVVEIG